MMMLEQLRQTLRALEKPPALEGDPGSLPLGIEGIDAVLGGGLARGALHEIAALNEAHVAAATGLALGLAALLPSPRARGEGGERRSCEPGEGAFRQTQNRGDAPSPARLRSTQAGDLSPHAGRGARKQSIVWIAEDMALAESGVPYGGGLDAFALSPERLITVAAAHPRDLLWAMEEALRCRAIGVVIGEWRHGEIDTVAVRRLSLAAAESGALALMLRASPAADASTAATRWIAGAAPSAATPYGPGLPRFAAHLMRNRRGPTGSWILQWSDSDERFSLAPAQPLALPVPDRPHRANARRVA
jgi:protein ImuA